ncbi:MAG: TolC family protein, partial [Planctomycetota bacterium]
EEVAPVRDLVMKMAAAGEAPQTEVRAFDLEILTATGNAQHLTREADRQRKAIVAMLGLVPEAPVELHPALDATVPDDTGFAADSAGLGLHRSAHDVAEAAVRLEIAKQYPDLTIGIHGGVEDGQARIGLGFGLPFPILNTNRSGIASSRAERRVTKAAWEETVELLAQRLADLRYALGNTRTHITFLADELAPVIDQQLEDVTHLAGMGQFDAALQLDALRQRHETRLALVDSKLTAEIARAQIDALLHPGRERNTTNTVESDQ